MAWLLWITLVFGGLFMGGGAVWAQVQGGFDPILTLSAVLYLGSGLYCVPFLVRLIRGGGR